MRTVVLYSPGLVAKVINVILDDAEHDVLMVHKANEAVQLVEENEIDAVLIGMDTTDLDCFQVCKDLRSVRYNGPILILSRSEDLERKLKAFKHGADDYLREPFEPDELLARVEAIARRCRHLDHQPLGTVVKVGDAELSMGDMTFQSGDQPPVTLTPTEMRLLERLMRNAGITISRDTLIERTWGYDFFGDSNRVDVYIARIRKKIEADAARPHYLHTIRGAGYVFRVNKSDPPLPIDLPLPAADYIDISGSSVGASSAE